MNVNNNATVPNCNLKAVHVLFCRNTYNTSYTNSIFVRGKISSYITCNIINKNLTNSYDIRV